MKILYANRGEDDGKLVCDPCWRKEDRLHVTALTSRLRRDDNWRSDNERVSAFYRRSMDQKLKKAVGLGIARQTYNQMAALPQESLDLLGVSEDDLEDYRTHSGA
jgi:hypothetical protein